jgi:serine/threonine-protein kinase
MDQRHAIQRTTTFGGPSSAPRCRVAGSWVGGSRFDEELASLLLLRLRMVTLIALVPSLLFLVRNLFDGSRPLPATALHAILNLFVAWLAGFLWSRSAFSLHALRTAELGLFGAHALFFGWLQFHMFDQSPLLPAVSSGLQADVMRLITISSAVRWFFLIVIYGVFIPNTWKRCAVVVGSGALLPLVLTPLGAAVSGWFGPALHAGLLDMAILMLTGVAVAVFGSYRFQVLQQQAFEAQQLGQYRLKERLGSGGMGEVYLAEHVLLRRPCAIKLIRPEQAGDPTTMQRFEREVRAMATLTHWNTVEVFDYGHADDGTFYYVMEYLPGVNLETLVARHGPLPAERAIHFLRQVCRALREAHLIGLLHRDIKPSNIIVCERGATPDVVKLLDFGLVQNVGLGKDVARLTLQGTVLGSPPYMSPEQAAGRTDLSAQSDIYSLGAVAYYLLTGQPPFARETAMQMLLAHAYEPVLPLTDMRPDVPADLQAVVLRCLQKKADARYPSAEALERALARCAGADGWTEERAAAWWQGVAGQAETEQHAALGTATPP